MVTRRAGKSKALSSEAKIVRIGAESLKIFQADRKRGPMD